MRQDVPAEGARRRRRGIVGGLWSAAVLLFGLGAAIASIGIYAAFVKPGPWEAVSLVLLGSGLILMSLGLRRGALGVPPGRLLRVAASGLVLVAVAIHFLLV